MEQEMSKLRELEKALQVQRTQQEVSCQTGMDRSDTVSRASVGSNASGSLAGFAEVYGAELSRLQAVVEEQRRKLSSMEDAQRRSEDGLLRKQSVMEEMFLASNERLEVQKQQLRELEHKYQTEDLSSLDSVSSQSSWLEQLETRQSKLRAYIDEKEQDFQSDAERVDPIGESGSDESLTSSKGYKRHVKAALMQQQQHKRTGSDSGHYSYLLHQSTQYADVPVPGKFGKPARRASSPSQSPSPSNRKPSPKLKPSLLAEQVTARLYRPPPAKKLTDVQGGARSKQPSKRPTDLQLAGSSSESSAPNTPRSALLKSLPGGNLIPGSPSLRLSSSSLASVPESMDESLPDSEQMDISESWPIQRRHRSPGRPKPRPASLPDSRNIPIIKVDHQPTKIVPFIPPKLGPNRPKGAILSLMQPLPLKKQRVQRSDSDPTDAASRIAKDDNSSKGSTDMDTQREGVKSDKSIPSPSVPTDAALPSAVGAAASAAVEAGSSTRSKPTFQRDAPPSPSSLHRPTMASMAKQAPHQPYVSPARRSPSSSRSSSAHSQERRHSVERKHSLERRYSQGDNTPVRGRGAARKSPTNSKPERKRPGSAPGRPGSASPQRSPRPQRSSSKESMTSERSQSRGSSHSERSTSRDSSHSLLLDSPGPIRRQVTSKIKDSPGSVRKDKSASPKSEESIDSGKSKATKRSVKPGSPLSRPKKRSKDSDIPVEIYLSSRQRESSGSTDDRESPHRSGEHTHQIFVSSLRGGSEVDASQPFTEEVFQTEDGTKVIMRSRTSTESENMQDSAHGPDELDTVRQQEESGESGGNYELNLDGTLEALAGADHSSDEGQVCEMDYSSDSLDGNTQQLPPGVSMTVHSESQHSTTERSIVQDSVRASVASSERMSCDSLEASMATQTIPMVQSTMASTNASLMSSGLASRMDTAAADNSKSLPRSQDSTIQEGGLSFHLNPPNNTAENRSQDQVTSNPPEQCQPHGEVQGQPKTKADVKSRYVKI